MLSARKFLRYSKISWSVFPWTRSAENGVLSPVPRWSIHRVCDNQWERSCVQLATHLITMFVDLGVRLSDEFS
jgi:hypothetical protein